jgi:hypothetical protein
MIPRGGAEPTNPDHAYRYRRLAQGIDLKRPTARQAIGSSIKRKSLTLIFIKRRMRREARS